MPFTGLIRSFHIQTKIHSHKRQGPHDFKVLQAIVGSLLGDAHLEIRVGGVGSRFKVEHASRNVEYLM